jgi:hypothetical protein
VVLVVVAVAVLAVVVEGWMMTVAALVIEAAAAIQVIAEVDIGKYEIVMVCGQSFSRVISQRSHAKEWHSKESN